MGIYSDAFAEQFDDTYSKTTFIIKKFYLGGELCRPIIDDEEVVRILEFKGTGEKKRFIDILIGLEVKNRNAMLDNHNNCHNRDYKRQEQIWVDEYIIQNNFQVIFEKDDIVLRKSKSAA